jgi:hypothetical protein
VVEFSQVDAMRGRQHGEQIAVVVAQQNALGDLVAGLASRGRRALAGFRMLVMYRLVFQVMGLEKPP